MIEEALRRRLQPIVNRRKRLNLAWRLSAYWLSLGLVGIGLIGTNWLWGWSSPIANGALCISIILATVFALYKSRCIQPDYKAVARNIERQHSDLKALLLTAIEQEPPAAGGSGPVRRFALPDGQLGYLQERVIGEALRHAANHDWLRSVPPRKLALANLSGIAALSFLIVVLSQMLPSTSSLLTTDGGVLARKDYHITVTPGDTSVESGTPVVILARFDGRVPSEASLLFGPAEGGSDPFQGFALASQGPQKIALAKNLEDPVFGGIIGQVNCDLLYHIEYAGRRTRDYSITVYEHPRLSRADAKIIYPSYTRLPEKVIIDTRRVSAVEGSQINLTFILNKPVTTAQLLAKDQPTLDLIVDDELPNVYAISVTATQNQRYELHLADAQGLKNKMPPRFVIDVHKNLLPELKAVFPNRDVQASPLEELSLEAEVSDDFGVTSYGLSYTVAGTQSKDLILGELPLSKDKQLIQYLLALEDLNAQPGQLLTYYFWADDVGPEGKVRRTTSDMYFAEVRHFEEIFRESQSFQDERSQNQRERQSGEQSARGGQGEQLARLQKQIISATWNIKRQTDQSGEVDDQKEDLDVVRRSQADVLDRTRSAMTQTEDPPATAALQGAAKHMETALDHLGEATELTPALAAEQSAYQELLKLREREHQVALGRNPDRSNSARSARSERQLQQLELRQRESRYEMQRLAQSQQQATQREDLQVLNRLRELARRQNEMSSRLKEAQAALRQAQTEEQRQEINRELRRLREQQLESLRDVDELAQRMEMPENRQRMADAREQLDQSRSRIRQSTEELEQGMVSRAVTSTTRAQRQLEQMRDEFQRRTSGQFSEQMRNMREQAQQLDQRQKEIGEEIQQQIDAPQKTLADSGAKSELVDRIEQQRSGTEDLLEQMKDVSDQAETSEPLLSRRLYDTLRNARTDNVDRALQTTGELLRRNFLPQAQEIERQAGQGIEELRRGVEEAARSVLGDGAESLRLARQQIDELIRQVNDEAARVGGAGQRQFSDSNEPANSAADQSARADADAQSGTDGERQERQSARDGSQRQATVRADERGPGRSPGPDQTGLRPADPTGWGGNQPVQRDGIDPNGPLTGRDFRQWSDRLRDVEEMLTAPDLRNEVARVRDRARSIRAEFTRHGKEPQWDLVRQQITNPLIELRHHLSEELAKLQSDEAMVPIDRDPVPSRFTELVRRYYENLGGD